MERLQAWLCLKSSPRLKLKGSIDLLEKYPDPLKFVGRPEHPLYRESWLDEEDRQHLSQGVLPENFPQIAKLCQHYDIRVMTYTDEDFPPWLREIVGPPLLLYYRGDLPAALQRICLGVVGTRKATAYGRNCCARLLEPVCRQQVTIVSGLALGIDSAAHQAAVQAGCPTIAVLGCGVDRVYPSQNYELAEKIVANGALVSEYDPGSRPDPWNFPARNRIISALSQKVFIVEGPLSSGAMLTAKYALDQNRDVLALPGEITHPNSQGPNYLIKNGAQCVTCPEDILDALGLDQAESAQLEVVPELSEDEQAVYDLFRDRQRELSFDELLLATGHGFGKLSTLLLNLELKGCICRSGGNSFVLA